MRLEGCSLGRRAQAGLHLESFLVWIARNSLKSPESDEGIQENPSPFSWSGLVWIGFGLENFGLRPLRRPGPVAPGARLSSGSPRGSLRTRRPYERRMPAFARA